jgi:DNA-binding NarL/FixJ family response regulator
VPAVTSPTLQLLAWIAERDRTYAQTMEAWKSSCPRLTVWEDAIADGLVRIRRDTVLLTAAGTELLSMQPVTELWAERARTELQRVATRQAPATLTPTERQIAQLAADGLTNKGIAARMFVSAKTVEANLSRVYRKLGISARTQLGRALAEAQPPPS